MLKAILTDIEGTTSSIRFVRDVLFPYAYNAIPEYIERHADDEELSALLKEASREAGLADNDRQAVVQSLLEWIEQDRKITALKTIQGKIWEAGYRQGDYQAHVYPDAYEMLQQWHRSGIPIYVYSSGSVKAQKLFFQFSEFGDLSYLFKGHFDTTTGPKKSAQSYTLIANQLGLEPQSILFLSDIVEELQAAQQAGMDTVWLVRPQDTSASEHQIMQSKFRSVKTFDQIQID